jgi:hypothetical protein
MGGLLSGLGDVVKQMAGGSGGEQLTQLAAGLPQSSVASGLAEVFRSPETAPFAQLASQLFSKSNGEQQASVLNSLVAAAGPEVLATLTGSASSPLASLLAENQTPITAEQAVAIKPEDIQTLAEHAEKADPSIVDKLSALYAAHPQLIQGLGAVAVAIAMKHITEKHS